MKTSETCGCLTRQIFVKCDSYWCLVDEPEECPYSIHFDETYTCIHPDRQDFARKSARVGSGALTPGPNH